MTSLPEQFSAARKWQLDTQFDFFRAVTTQVIESTEQVIALNIDTSRAAVERSADTVRQLFAARDPRDLLTLGGQGEEQFQQMLAYTRELFSIVANAQGRLAGGARSFPAPAVGQGAAPHGAATEPAAPPADAQAGADEAAAGGKRVKPSKKPVVAAAPEAEPEPAAAEKPIAKAAGKLGPRPAAAQHPMASPVVAPAAEVAIPPVLPVDAAPPPAPASGTPEIDARQAELATFRNGRKK